MTHFTPRDVFIITICTAIMPPSCVADHLPQPKNLSSEWTDEFCMKLTWQAPRLDLAKCKVWYLITRTDSTNQTRSERLRLKTSHSYCITTEENGLRYTIETDPGTSCGSLEAKWTRSKPLKWDIYPPVRLVSDFKCFLYSSGAMNCSWIPEYRFPDLECFYKLCDCGHPEKPLSKCEHPYSNGIRKGCHLKGVNTDTDICILVRGSSNGATVLHNTFKRTPFKNVQPPPPQLNITEQGDKLTLSWTAPDIGASQRCWSYLINYSTCNEFGEERIEGKESMMLSYDKRCLYKFQIRADFRGQCGKGGSGISEVVSYGREESPDPLAVAVIVIPGLLSACVILSCYCFRRNRAIICPIVPDPSVIFKEMMMNRTKEPQTTTGNLYIPVAEVVESCKLTPVVEVDPLQPNS